MSWDYSQVEREIENGRLWRAKEILRGRLGTSSYDGEFFHRYADVLASMHDDDEAGRYYFLSGHRDGAAKDLSAAFLFRRQRLNLRQLWATMPNAGRRLATDVVPDAVKSDLVILGHDNTSVSAFIAELMQEHEAAKSLTYDKRNRWPSTLIEKIVGPVLLAAIVLLLALGTFQAAQLIGSVMRRIGGT